MQKSGECLASLITNSPTCGGQVELPRVVGWLPSIKKLLAHIPRVYLLVGYNGHGIFPQRPVKYCGPDVNTEALVCNWVLNDNDQVS